MAQRDLDDPPECDRLVRARDLGRGSPDIVDWARPATRVRSGRQSYCGRRCRPGRPTGFRSDNTDIGAKLEGMLG
jgi:hypothetical protein